MAEVNRTAAYIRAREARKAPPPLRNDLEAATWSALGTAHTVESLLRKIGNDATDAAETERRIVAALGEWLDEERIELATDS